MAPAHHRTGQTVPMSRSESRKERSGKPILTPLVQDRWLPSVFSLVPDGAARRRPSDIVRVVLATVVVLVAAVGSSWITTTETWFGDGVEAVPDSIRWLLAIFGPA